MLLLASASPRRTELLDLMGIHHEVVEQKFDEDSVKDLDPIVCSQNIVKGKNISARQLLVGSPKENLPKR